MIRMGPRHFGQAPLNSEELFRPPIKRFLLNHGQVTLSGRYYSTGQVKGSTFNIVTDPSELRFLDFP